METNKDFTFEVLISKDCYAAKPEHSQYELMEFQKVVVNPTTLLDYVRQGHSFCHVHKNERRLKGNFKYTNFVNIDIDDSTVSMSEFLKRPIIKPTLAYTTFSNKILGYRYRLLYCFSEPIDAQTYVPLYRWICAYIGLSKTKDHCGHVTNQLMNGNSLADIELYLSNRIYKISDFVQPGLLEL